MYSQIRRDIIRGRNPVRAKRNRVFHKYGGYGELGVGSKRLDVILRAYRREIMLLTCREALKLAERFYRSEFEEMKLAGNYILKRRNQCIEKGNLAVLDRVARGLSSWSQTDDFCIGVLQPLLERHPKETIGLLRAWNGSGSVWKRRASVVAFVRKVGESGKYTDAALRLCENLIWDKEDLVCKGVGWCLKDVMRGDRERVLAYVRGLRKRGVSAVITLYAIRDLGRAEHGGGPCIKD